MRHIVLNGADWKTCLDFYDALLAALGPLGGHGHSVDAFIDSMIYGGMLEAEPPYEVCVRSVGDPGVRADVLELSRYIAEARAWRRANYGDDVDVAITLLHE